MIGHIGDSRAYLLRDGELKLLTRDHTHVQELIDMGDLTIRAAKRHPKQHALFRYLGMQREAYPDVTEQPLKPGDRLLLCSDGLHGYTPDSAIRRVPAGRGGPDRIAQRAVSLVLRGKAPDNVSAVVIAVESAAGNLLGGRRARGRTRRRPGAGADGARLRSAGPCSVASRRGQGARLAPNSTAPRGGRR